MRPQERLRIVEGIDRRRRQRPDGRRVRHVEQDRHFAEERAGLADDGHLVSPRTTSTALGEHVEPAGFVPSFMRTAPAGTITHEEQRHRAAAGGRREPSCSARPEQSRGSATHHRSCRRRARLPGHVDSQRRACWRGRSRSRPRPRAGDARRSSRSGNDGEVVVSEHLVAPACDRLVARGRDPGHHVGHAVAARSGRHVPDRTLPTGSGGGPGRWGAAPRATAALLSCPAEPIV